MCPIEILDGEWIKSIEFDRVIVDVGGDDDDDVVSCTAGLV